MWIRSRQVQGQTEGGAGALGRHVDFTVREEGSCHEPELDRDMMREAAL